MTNSTDIICIITKGGLSYEIDLAAKKARRVVSAIDKVIPDEWVLYDNISPDPPKIGFHLYIEWGDAVRKLVAFGVVPAATTYTDTVISIH